MNPRLSHKNAAFSLIEIAVVITIFSLLMAGLLSNQTLRQETTRVTSQDTNLDMVQEAIKVFFIQKRYVPCPASLSQAPNTAFYGVSTDCSLTTAPAGTRHVPIGTADPYQLRIGAVPTRTLGIPDKYAFDQWGNRISYVVMRNMAVNSPFSPTATTGYFQITDSANAVTYGNSNTELVAYILIVHGADGKGATSKQGAAGLTCSTTAADKENCDDDKQFMDAVPNATSGTTFYDDSIRWVKKSDL
jgi:prepilin-type N-terminal cleavage/methylation domain-containing protein